MAEWLLRAAWRTLIDHPLPVTTVLSICCRLLLGDLETYLGKRDVFANVVLEQLVNRLQENGISQAVCW